jgi:hypothetical protein
VDACRTRDRERIGPRDAVLRHNSRLRGRGGEVF